MLILGKKMLHLPHTGHNNNFLQNSVTFPMFLVNTFREKLKNNELSSNMSHLPNFRHNKNFPQNMSHY